MTRVELEIKRSRFIGLLARTDDQESARAVIDSERKQYPDARHHCTAYVVDSRNINPVLHFSDDGEPAGTAGKPMLDVLQHAGLKDVTAVVTRYFGGTLLGTGGLVRAYSSAVQAAIEAAPLVRVVALCRFRAHLNPADGGKVEAQLRASGWDVVDSVWSSDLQLDIAAPAEDLENLNSQLSALIQAPGTFHQVGTISREVDTPRDQA